MPTITKLAHHASDLSYYDILGISKTADLSEIKHAYHRSLLAAHPDKNTLGKKKLDIEISTLKEAFQTLSSEVTRREYDSICATSKDVVRQRLAQVISLDDFTELSENDTWAHPCRCGDMYRINESELENGKHLVSCGSCSEMIWVGYEIAGDDQK